MELNGACIDNILIDRDSDNTYSSIITVRYSVTVIGAQEGMFQGRGRGVVKLQKGSNCVDLCTL